MKLLSIAFILIFATLAFSNTVEDEWKDFKVKYEKTYSDEDEHEKRFEIFKQNVKDIEEHNARYEKGEETFTKGINKFADLTHEEIKSQHTGRISSFKKRTKV